MVKWVAKWLGWFLLRWGITLGCAFTLQHSIQQVEGIHLPPEVLLLGTALFVGLIKLWTFDTSTLGEKKPKQDLSQADI